MTNDETTINNDRGNDDNDDNDNNNNDNDNNDNDNDDNNNNDIETTMNNDRLGRAVEVKKKRIPSWGFGPRMR